MSNITLYLTSNYYISKIHKVNIYVHDIERIILKLNSLIYLVTIMPILGISYFSFSHLQIFTLLNGLEVKQL